MATSGTDSDFVVKLIDVYPDDFPQPSPAPSPAPPPPANAVRMGGYQQLVRGEPFRGKFRKSFEQPVAFTPGQADLIRFTMPDVAHTFRRGHRVMVQVQSSWFPLVDRNPQKFVDIAQARAEDFQKATQRVYRSAERPSSLGLWVLNEAGGRYSERRATSGSTRAARRAGTRQATSATAPRITGTATNVTASTPPTP